MRVKWIEYRGRQILYADFRSLRKNEEGMETLELLGKMLAGSPAKALVLYNFEGATATPAWMARVKQMGKEVFEPKVDRAAAVGIVGVKAILLEAYNKATRRNLKSFKTEAEALEWLVEGQGGDKL